MRLSDTKIGRLLTLRIETSWVDPDRPLKIEAKNED
jgi:hypothetical protein